MKFHPLTLFALAAGLAVSGAFAESPGYTLVVEPYDWGPAVSKIVVDLGRNAEVLGLTSGDFGVTAARPVTDWSGQVSPTSGPLTIRQVSFSTAEGAPLAASAGRFLTLGVEVGPSDILSSPFFYDLKTGQNRWVDLAVSISSPRLGLTLGPTAQGPRSVPSLAEVDLSGVKEYQDADYGKIVLRYASYAPVNDGKKHPLVIWLHGAGEGGTDPTVALLGNKVTALVQDPIQTLMGGAYVLIPQTPRVWMNNGVESYPKDGSTQYTRAVKAVIDDYIGSNPSIDPDRVYLGGCSNGGFMTMKLLLTYPGFFAAAYPACEAYADRWISDDQIKALAQTPIWFTQAKTDTVVNAAQGGYVLNTYRRLVATGAPDVHLSYWDKVEDLSGRWTQADGKTPYEYMGHWSWIYTLNNACSLDADGNPVLVGGKAVSLWAWLAHHRR